MKNIFVMKLAVLLATAIFGLCSAGSTFAADLENDPALAATVTLDCNGEAISDILYLLEYQTGVDLAVTKDVADQKATIYVEDKPLSEIMTGLTTIFGYKWRTKQVNEKKKYELFKENTKQPDTEKEKQERRQKAMEDIQKQLDTLVQYADKSEEELKAMNEQLMAKMNMPGQSIDMSQFQAVSTLLSSPSAGPIAKLYKTFSPDALEALWSGMEVCFDSDTPETGWKIPDDITRAFLDADRKRQEWYDEQFAGNANYVPPVRNEVNAVNIKYRIEEDSDSLNLVHSMGYRQTGETGLGVSSGSFCSSSLKAPDDEPERPVQLPKADEEQIKELNEKKVTITSQEIAEEANISGQTAAGRSIYATKSDMLALLHAKAGMQIISDHYSEWMSRQSIKDAPLYETLENIFIGSVFDYDTVLGWDGKYLYGRVLYSKEFDAKEVPNRLLNPWRKAVTKQGRLDLDQLAEIAQLSDEQLQSVSKYYRFLGLGEINNNWGFPNKAIKLYGTLSQRQKTEAFSGGTPVSAFNQVQLAALKMWINEVDAYDPVKMSVGIYMDGVRVDKPQDQARQLVSFNIREGGIDDSMNFDFLSPDRPPIEDPQEENTKGKFKPGWALVRNMAYIAELRFSDKYLVSSWIRVPMQKLPPETEPQRYFESRPKVDSNNETNDTAQPNSE